MSTHAHCKCHESGIDISHLASKRHLGIDETHGRFADVSLLQCSICGSLWLHYRVEYEGFSRSGRWGMALISEATASITAPETAADYIDQQPWCVIGGSYWNSSGKRGMGPLHWG
jgi:hypothetical protein